MAESAGISIASARTREAHLVKRSSLRLDAGAREEPPPHPRPTRGRRDCPWRVQQMFVFAPCGRRGGCLRPEARRLFALDRPRNPRTSALYLLLDSHCQTV